MLRRCVELLTRGLRARVHDLNQSYKQSTKPGTASLVTGMVVDVLPDRAVREVHSLLWKHGGCFAQCEFGAGAKPENVRQVYQSWDALTNTQ